MFGTKKCTIEIEFHKNEITNEQKKEEEKLIIKELKDFFEQKKFITKKKPHLSIGRLVKNITQTMIFFEIPENTDKKYMTDLFLEIMDVLTEDFNYDYKYIRFSSKKFEKDFLLQLSSENPTLFDRLN